MKNNTTPSILVVEDEKTILDTIVLKLKMEGYEVTGVRSAREALDLIDQGIIPQLIWVDHYLIGNASGLDLVEKIKANPKTNSIPVFVVSNTAGFDTIEAYSKLGVAQYYTKSDNALNIIIEDIKKHIPVRNERGE